MYQYKSHFFLKMNMCLCIERDTRLSHFTRLSPSDCNYKCEDNTDDIYSGDCGGESAYNIYETQEGTKYMIKDREL